MPPWHANPKFGSFENERHMPESDRQLLRDWVAAGAPFGNKEEAPKPLTFVEGWNLASEPDLVLEMSNKPFVIPADGTVEYQYFVVDPKLEKDTWVIGAEVIPGNRSVVHHSIVFIRPPDGTRFRGIGWLTAYVPGQRAVMFPPGHARLIPAKSKLVFQQHYTPVGTEQEDITKIGMIFGEEKQITHDVYTLVGIDQEFEIPPQAANHTVQSRVSNLPKNASLLAISPHMHLRGKSFRASAKHGAKTSILLDVPRYDFNWQHVYRLREPVALDQVDKLEFTVVFDNSSSNPTNPNPNEHVTWGDQTWEEMAVAFFEVAVPRVLDESSIDEYVSEIATSKNDSGRVKKFVGKFFKKFDKNGDGVVKRRETPRSMQAFGFWQFDNDGDGELTKKEIESAARSRFKE